jgi:hypothetical protein
VRQRVLPKREDAKKSERHGRERYYHAVEQASLSHGCDGDRAGRYFAATSFAFARPIVPAFAAFRVRPAFQDAPYATNARSFITPRQYQVPRPSARLQARHVTRVRRLNTPGSPPRAAQLGLSDAAQRRGRRAEGYEARRFCGDNRPGTGKIVQARGAQNSAFHPQPSAACKMRATIKRGAAAMPAPVDPVP